MKLFTNKKLIQKITIVMVFLILFNFIVPTYSKAGVVDVIAEGAEAIGEALAPIINVFARIIGDGILTVIQKMFIGTDPFENDEIKIAISPGKIFSGLIYTLDINFISKKNITASSNNDSNVNNKNMEDTEWYKLYKESLDILGEKKNSYTQKVDTDKEHAWTLLMNSIYAKNSEIMLQKLEVWSEKLGSTYSKEDLYKVIKETSTYDYNAYLEKTTEDEMDKKALDLLGDIKFEKVIKKYLEYKADNDPALYFASKPENAPAYVLHDTIATWYKIMRNIALVFLLSVLVYVGIRIMLSSTAADNTKYKKMLVDWVVALCILFALHYLMAFTINVTQLIVDAFTGKDVTVTSTDQIMYAVRDKASNNNTSGLGYTLLYLVLIFYTIYFLFYYVKRVVYIAFLTLISPLVSLTYPLDKMGDSKAQAFEMWLREYIMNVIVQPIHLLIYTTMVSSALTLAENNPIYAIVVIGAMIPAEKFIKEMFGLESKKGPKGGFLAGATTMGMMQKIANKKPPQFGHHSGENGKGGSDKTQEKTKKPRMDGEKNAELSRDVTGAQNNTAHTNDKPTTKNTGTENLPNIDNGDFGQNNSQPEWNSNLSSEQVDELKAEGIEPGDPEYDHYLAGHGIKQNVPDNSQPEWNSNLSEDQIDELKAEGIEPGDAEYDRYLADHGIKDEQMKNMNKANNNTEIKKSGDSASTNNGIQQNGIISNNVNQENDEKQKKRNIRRAALGATAGHYARKIFNRKNAKKLGRGLVKLGLGAVTAGTGAVIGVAAGVASGDPSNAFKLAAAGGLAGYKIGENVGDGVANLAGGVLDIRDTYKAQKNEIIKYDKEAQKAEMHKENKKFAESAETKAAIKKKYGKLSKEEMGKRQEAIVRYRDNGVEDLDIIFNSYNLEQGKDYYGNTLYDEEGKELELSPNHAMYIAQMASKMDDSASSRKSVENSMQTQFAQNYEEDGMDSEKAWEHAKALRKREMQYVDMARGNTVAEAASIAKQAEINKKNEDRKEEKAASMQAKFNAEAQRNIVQNQQSSN